jgi:hypothetical protein
MLLTPLLLALLTTAVPLHAACRWKEYKWYGCNHKVFK